MIGTAYLYKGLCRLAHAHRANPMAGHLGAAIIAGYFLGEELSPMDERVEAGITGELDRILNGEESTWFNPQEAGITIRELFAPIPSESSQEAGIPAIAEALSGNIDKGVSRATTPSSPRSQSGPCTITRSSPRQRSSTASGG